MMTSCPKSYQNEDESSYTIAKNGDKLSHKFAVHKDEPFYKQHYLTKFTSGPSLIYIKDFIYKQY